MKTSTTEELAELIARHRFGAAAAAINDRYRQLSERILDVFDDFICTLAGTSVVSDFQNLMALLHVGGPSRRRALREFVGSRKVQNCLTAVLLSIEKSVPTDVKMGFRKPSDFFRESEFFGTYSADIVNYEPEFSRLTDRAHLLLAGISDNLGYDQNTRLQITTMWSITNPPGSSNRAHIHPGALWSGVYYVQAPENAGAIEFTDPRTVQIMNSASFIPNKRRKTESLPETIG